jgi:menaquinone-dependent protoporphyrinogen oxidase
MNGQRNDAEKGKAHMARILVIYGSTEGQTAKIATALGRDLRAQGEEAFVIEACDGAPGPVGYDGVIVAASVHAGGYQRCVRRWARRHAGDLSHTPNAFVSVCLGVLQHDPAVDRQLAAIRERFVEETGWHPMTTKVVAGALPYTQYNWAKRLVLKRIVQKAGGDTDTSRDYEYTDWEDLRAFARAFAVTVQRCLERLGEPAGVAVGAA